MGYDIRIPNGIISMCFTDFKCPKCTCLHTEEDYYKMVENIVIYKKQQASNNRKQFLDLCIMFGCDYNKNIPKIGPETSYKYIRKFGSIEEIENKLELNVSILNHIRTRELFTGYEEIDLNSVHFCGSPDLISLHKFIVDNNLNINLEKLKKDFTHNNNIVFVEE